MDPSIRRGIRKRSDWIRRNPGAAGDYVRLTKADREKVDRLFLADRKLKAGEVSSLVERLKEAKLAQRRIGDLRRKALANMRTKLGDRVQFHDGRVSKNVGKMKQKDLKLAAASSTDELIALARVQDDENLFFYH